MRVAFDSVILGAYLHPEAAYPTPVDRVPDRLKHLVDLLEAARATIIVPTPALSEFLVLAAGDTAAYVAELTNSALFAVEPFDLKAAIEAAETQRRAIDAGRKKSGATGPWQKVKVDRQIVAIAKVHGVDEHLRTRGGRDAVRTGSDMVCTPTMMMFTGSRKPTAFPSGTSRTCPCRLWIRSRPSFRTRSRTPSERRYHHSEATG